MIRRKSKFNNSYWWGCVNFPKCGVTSVEHPNGSIMSIPADKELKALKIKTHRLLEQKFGDWEDKTVKKKMYKWLKDNTVKGHIGLMDEKEVTDTIKMIESEELK